MIGRDGEFGAAQAMDDKVSLNKIVVQVPGNLGTGVNNDPYIVQITINSNGTLTNPAGTAGNGTAPKDNLTLASVTYRAR